MSAGTGADRPVGAATPPTPVAQPGRSAHHRGGLRRLQESAPATLRERIARELRTLTAR